MPAPGRGSTSRAARAFDSSVDQSPGAAGSRGIPECSRRSWSTSEYDALVAVGGLTNQVASTSGGMAPADTELFMLDQLGVARTLRRRSLHTLPWPRFRLKAQSSPRGCLVRHRPRASRDRTMWVAVAGIDGMRVLGLGLARADGDVGGGSG